MIHDDHFYANLREQFTDADTRFQQALAGAFTAHSQCVALFLAALERIERREDEFQQSLADVQETVDELRRLLLDPTKGSGGGGAAR